MHVGKKKTKLNACSLIVGALGASVFIIIAVILMARAKYARKSSRNGKNFEAVVMLRQYSYAKVKKMTNSFAHVLGKGGFKLSTKENYLMEAKTLQ